MVVNTEWGAFNNTVSSQLWRMGGELAETNDIIAHGASYHAFRQQGGSTIH